MKTLKRMVRRLWQELVRMTQEDLNRSILEDDRYNW